MTLRLGPEARARVPGFALCLAAVLVALGPFVFQGKVPVNGEWLTSGFAPWRGAFADVPENPELDDPILWQYPNKRLMAEALRSGRIPLWNPAILCGSTQVGDSISNPLDPFNVLYLPLPFDVAYGLTLLLKWVLAGWGMVALARRVGASRLGAAAAGLAFLLNSRFTTQLELRNAVDSFFLLPWILDGVLRILEGPLPGRMASVAALVGVQGLSGDAQSLAMCLPWLLAAAVLRAFFRPRPARPLAGLACAGLALALGVALALPQILPLLEAIARSARSGAEQYRERNFLHPESIPVLVFPEFLGNPVFRNLDVNLLLDADGKGHRTFLTMAQGYAGGIGFCLAVLGAGARGSPVPRVLGGMALGLLAFLLALGNGALHGALASAMPMLDNVDLLRSLVFWGFAVSLLAGLGFDRIRQGGARLKRPLLAAGLLFLMAWLAVESWAFRAAREIDLASPESRDEILDHDPLILRHLLALLTQVPPDPLPHGAVCLAPQLRCSFLFLLAGWLSALCRLEGRRGMAPAWLLLALHGGELLFFGTRYNPFTAPGRIHPRTPEADFLVARRGEGRVFGVAPPGSSPAKGDHFPPNSLLLSGVADVRGKGYCPLRVGRFLAAMEKLERPRHLMERSPRKVALSSKLFPLTGARYVLMGEGPGDLVQIPKGIRWIPRAREEPPAGYTLAFDGRRTRIYAVDAAMPRAFFAGQAHYVFVQEEPSTAAEVFALMEKESLDPRRHVVVETPRAGRRARQPEVGMMGKQGDPAATASVTIIDDEPERVRVRVEAASADGWLVLLDTWDEGWESTVNGAPAAVLPAFHAFRAVAVPKGGSVVEFRYRPAPFRWGLQIAGWTAVALAALAAAGSRRRAA